MVSLLFRGFLVCILGTVALAAPAAVAVGGSADDEVLIGSGEHQAPATGEASADDEVLIPAGNGDETAAADRMVWPQVAKTLPAVAPASPSSSSSADGGAKVPLESTSSASPGSRHGLPSSPLQAGQSTASDEAADAVAKAIVKSGHAVIEEYAGHSSWGGLAHMVWAQLSGFLLGVVFMFKRKAGAVLDRAAVGEDDSPPGNLRARPKVG